MHVQAETCLRSLIDALAKDPDEDSTRPGMLALQLWCYGADGPDGQLARSKFHALDAGVVATQAALSHMPPPSYIEGLASRVQAVEIAETNRLVEHEVNGGELFDAAIAKRTREDIEHFRMVLAETSHTIGSLQSELRTKAGQMDTSSSLELLRREIIRLAATTVGKHQLNAGLSSKLDRRDLGRIAALIANGELDGIKAAV